VLIFLQDFVSLFYIGYVLFSVLGISVSPYFYAYHLFHCIFFFTELHRLFQAIRMSFWRIVVTLMLTLVIAYAFAIFGVLFFQNQYDRSEFRFCEKPWECFFTHLEYGLPLNGALIDFLTPLDIERDDWPAVFTFYMAWWLAISVIMLNVILAIFVDMFSELRQAVNDYQEEKATSCTICSLDRETFTKLSVSKVNLQRNLFAYHTKHEHNPQHYLYLFAHLARSETTACHLSRIEKYIREKLRVGIKSHVMLFLPIDRAIIADQHKKLSKTRNMLPKLYKNFKNYQNIQEKRFIETEKKVDRLIFWMRKFVQQQQNGENGAEVKSDDDEPSAPTKANVFLDASSSSSSDDIDDEKSTSFRC